MLTLLSCECYSDYRLIGFLDIPEGTDLVALRAEYDSLNRPEITSKYDRFFEFLRDEKGFKEVEVKEVHCGRYGEWSDTLLGASGKPVEVD